MSKFAKKESKFPGLLDNVKNTPAPTPTYTHEYTHTHAVKERKTRRVQLLMKESTVNELDSYAKQHDTSRNDIIQNLVEEFLKAHK